MAKALTSPGSVAAKRPVKRKTEKKSEPGFVKRKKRTKQQDSLPANKHYTVVDQSLVEVKKKKTCKQEDVIVIDTEEESVDGSGEQKEKRKRVAEFLNDFCVKNGNDKEVDKKKKKQLETPQFGLVKKVEKKPTTVKKIKAQIVKPRKEQEAEQRAGEDELPKKAKKRKNIVVVNAEEIEEQVKEKKKKKTTSVKITDGRKKSAQMKVTKNGVKLGTPEQETCEVEKVKVKRKRKKKPKVVAKEEQILAPPQVKGKNKKNKAASGQKVENENMLNKKKDKSTESVIVIIDEEEAEPKKKVKGRKVSVEVGIELNEPKKKRKLVNSKGEKEVPLLLDVQEQRREPVATGQKKKKNKKICVKVEAVSFGIGAKQKQIKEEAEDQDQQESCPVDVVFLSAKTGNADEVNINQERRQALQMDIDEASRPKENTGLGQWTTAQFDSSAQQQKFLRLIGGFKKASQPAAGGSDGANMALGKSAQQQLQQRLLGELEHAQSRRMDFSNRGSGLGFSAPVIIKKFSIDVNACRSVRFDD
ncbi:lysine-rich nucleolar protein 1 [Pseudoliparis swirei]|uniref:lysine-rich nucleolar protein 1 n=1 Tax=Pseudoliparis swirei TaxID=2059687 RepID=UPI0024BE08EB|nr:lysine-rich nucleolar protein 1 [Pseudoliparis swirei]XP_056265936.1 lysine-rich nucleolar protein 1 [Pseudoliparis swirei]